jgi:cysteine desulfurase
MHVYVDNNSTTPIHPDVVRELCTNLKTVYANPSASYGIARAARTSINADREECRRLFQAPHVVFVSSASEGNNLVIRGIVCSRRNPHVLLTAIEHPSVYKTVRALTKDGLCTHTVIPVDANGLIDPNDIRRLATPSTVLVCVIRSNNETGVIQDADAIAAVCASLNIHLHMDATQCVGKIPFRLEGNTAVVAAHKFRGPKAIAAVVFRNEACVNRPMCTGGGQEFGLRAGTESAALIRAFTHAARLAVQNTPPHLDAHPGVTVEALRDEIEQALEDMGFTINSRDVPRLPNTCSATMPKGHKTAEDLILWLDERGICANGGSACSKGKGSSTLRGMGRSASAEMRTLRVSLGTQNTRDEAAYLIDAIADFVKDALPPPTNNGGLLRLHRSLGAAADGATGVAGKLDHRR